MEPRLILKAMDAIDDEPDAEDSREAKRIEICFNASRRAQTRSAVEVQATGGYDATVTTQSGLHKAVGTSS
jgi:hypothetical protein